MKRILVSQNERNNNTDYLIVNGEFIDDENKMVYYGRKFAKAYNWEKVYKDKFLEISKNENQILFKSFYNDRDVIGRVIYYMYLIDEVDDFDKVLDFLEKDSLIINRSYDRDRTELLINQIKNKESIIKKIIVKLKKTPRWMLAGVSVLALLGVVIYLKGKK